ncbi:MAG: hypothetical protein A2087_03230 [Spirochaetes bacterium GWD1_61_31]|nr:MAG: hypothetical protein A2Y37_12755 [Spirochaetes bacterium GWB1_60_80]OHD32927.1 MAG: hypothetical protein A2004_00950 [Spirochaetes bacterium GWC1_61_12]OHD38689.1 MAG: hypothetical protein A2087_03230 [Spirochaetes bacterium GWD1_61_31]OHD43202.1 MAG: hypothetical protein A2Y35_08200 [Spirochaetes bacterium GWE1_60_18]
MGRSSYFGLRIGKWCIIEVLCRLKGFFSILRFNFFLISSKMPIFRSYPGGYQYLVIDAKWR